MTEFEKLMDRAGAYPYRKYGKIRVAFKQKLTKERTDAVIKVVQTHANKLAKNWNYPSQETLKVWQKCSYSSEPVCDDPPPLDYDYEKVDGFWILKYAKDRFCFEFVLDEPNKFIGKALSGHDMKVIRENSAKWFVDLTISKYQDIVKALTEKNNFGG